MSDTYLIEPGIGEWRTATVDGDDIPVSVDFIGEAALDPTDCVMTARVTKVDRANDMAFVALPTGSDGAIGFRRAHAFVPGKPKDELKSIADCATEGALVKVQVIGEASGLEAKAVPLTAKVKLVGRHLVIEQARGRLNFSKDIKPHAIGPLKSGLASYAEKVSIIVRSNAGLVPAQAVINEADWLMAAFDAQRGDTATMFSPSPLERALLAAPEGDKDIIIEGGSALADAKALAAKRWPELTPRLKGWDKSESMMEAMGVDEAIDEAIADRIDLPTGGWIAVYETPAFTAIDVNMAGAMAGRSAAEARRVTNLEAALATIFHMRFQNMGGIIVVDFIDNNAKGAVAEMMRFIDAALKDDDVPVQHTGLSAFGLLQFNRKRRGRSLRTRLMHQSAPSETASNSALTLLRRARRVGLSAESGVLVIKAAPAVIKWLEGHSALTVALSAETSRDLRLESGKTTDCYIEKS